jgi:hypothetical protein
MFTKIIFFQVTNNNNEGRNKLKMNAGSRRALTGSIHKIREFELEKVSV